MKKYKVNFTGRLSGAIGIFYEISDIVEMPEGSTFEEINLKIYDKYEHITGLKIKRL
jgi:hypothetical protein